MVSRRRKAKPKTAKYFFPRDRIRAAEAFVMEIRDGHDCEVFQSKKGWTVTVVETHPTDHAGNVAWFEHVMLIPN